MNEGRPGGRSMWHTIRLGISGATQGINLGAGALIATLLGAPFLIWSTILKHQTVRYQKEGHITDRINKAVEQLGAEKPIERIGRAVTIWTGQPDRAVVSSRVFKAWADKRRTKFSAPEVREEYNHETDEVEQDSWRTASTWPEERTIIQWQNEDVNLEGTETVGVEGAWQVFKETSPNIEVRTGGILSLERIAQDSIRFDNGRDHVRIMEILCAYIRENTAVPDLEESADRVRPFVPRTDVQIAVDVVKRRNAQQIEREEAAKYRLDLRRSDLRGMDMSRGSFKGAILTRCRFEFANLDDSDFSGARFDHSVLNYLSCYRTSFVGANMNWCRINRPEPVTGGFVASANMGNLTGVSFIGANIISLQDIDRNIQTFGTKDTRLFGELDEVRQENYKLRKNSKSPSDSDYRTKMFDAWSAHDSSDMVTGHLLVKMRKSLDLNEWPFRD